MIEVTGILQHGDDFCFKLCGDLETMQKMKSVVIGFLQDNKSGFQVASSFFDVETVKQ